MGVVANAVGGRSLSIAAGLFAAAAALAAAPDATQAGPEVATVTVSPDRPLARFDPATALGADLDGHEQGATRAIYTRASVSAMASAGLQSISYRLTTELAVEAWHWSARGRWSDQRRHEGYWSSSSVPGRTVGATYGYRLPRRGDTFDQASDDGYSRLDDGDERAFWKSNPYLDPHFTREPAGGHPQWIVVDLGRRRPVDALQLDWGAPYARRFRVEAWAGEDSMDDPGESGARWRPFPHAVFAGRHGRQRVRLADRARRVRWVRVLLVRGSHTAPRRARDVRDRLGFAVRELRVGRLVSGHLRDVLVHARGNTRQSPVYVSSTDPWHRARDRDPNVEQPSLTRVLASGLTHGLPLLVPVPVLYGTPADAAAELRYLDRLHVSLRGVELGEEPDGQYATPEDYGALYRQVARRLRRVDARVPLGGPSLQSASPDWFWWSDRRGDRSWMHRFLAELRARRALGDFDFFSFEWYPFENVCADPAAQLSKAPAMLARLLANQRRAGVPARVPTIVSEYGYSAYDAEDDLTLAGALLDADVVGTLLSHGGSAALPLRRRAGPARARRDGLRLVGRPDAVRLRRRVPHPLPDGPLLGDADAHAGMDGAGRARRDAARDRGQRHRAAVRLRRAPAGREPGAAAAQQGQATARRAAGDRVRCADGSDCAEPAVRRAVRLAPARPARRREPGHRPRGADRHAAQRRQHRAAADVADRAARGAVRTPAPRVPFSASRTRQPRRTPAARTSRRRAPRRRDPAGS
jgi:hypothetical protein